MSELIQIGQRGSKKNQQKGTESNISVSGLTYFIKTHGCQMNYSDTERVKTKLESYGYTATEDMKKADLIIFNTCSVKQKAEDKVFGQLKNLISIKRKNPNLLIGLTGCMVRKTSSINSEKKDKLLNRSKILDFVFRIEESAKLGGILNEINEDLTFPDFKEGELSNYFQINPKYTSEFQAFVPVGTGCDKFCTYCIVPYSRGREKSRNAKEIIEECAQLVAQGIIEITLVGQTVNSYGRSGIDRKSGKFTYTDDTTPFTELLKEIDKLHEKGLKRLRFTSPHPRDVHFSLMDAIANLRTVMPYIHMPLQAGHNETLKRMNRNYTIEEFRKIIELLREKVPDCAISTDIIVGFCGETKEEFQETLDIYKEFEFDHCYLSQYSPRTGTFSAQHLEDDVPQKTKRERWHKLNKLLKEISYKKMQVFEGETIEVLFEKEEKGEYLGRSAHYKEVRVKAEKNLIGQLLSVKIIEATTWHLKGELQ